MKKQLITAGVFALSSLGAAYASQPSAEQKQELIDHYRSASITTNDVQRVRAKIIEAARSHCHPVGPRRENDALQRRLCTQDFIGDVISGIGRPLLLSDNGSAFGDHGDLNKGACPNSSRQAFKPGPRKLHDRYRSCARASR